MDLLPTILATGIGATLVIDAWALVRERLWQLPRPNYAMVGRWIAHMPRGRFVHASIAKARAMRGEAAIGWIAHYLIGIAFAAVLCLVAGRAWFDHPTPGIAVLVGIATVFSPFLLMQPGMGAGLFARRTPRPSAARLQSLITHAIFGVGLYAAATIVRVASTP